MTVSMGAARAPQNGTRFEDLFYCADQALYAAKQQGRNRYRFYDESMSAMLSRAFGNTRFGHRGGGGRTGSSPMRRTRKPRTASAQAPAWLKAASAALLALLLCATFAFARAYTDLSNSIHRERVESVQQISSLISKKLNLLKERHEEETATAARFLSHSGATSMAQVDELLDHSDEFHLLSEDGRCLALDGSAIVVSSSMLSEDIGTWTEVRSEFCTVQSKGDFWVFAAPVENVSIDGVEIAGL